MKDKDLNDFVELCRFYGERFDLVQGPGGNISIKDNDGWMYIKSSGLPLSSVSKLSGFSEIDNTSLLIDILASNYQDINRYCFRGARPSMETYMHSLLYKYVVHLHPIQVNSILVRKDARKVCKELFPEALFLNYVTPGVKLAKKLRKEWKNQNLILLANHGIIVTSDSLTEVKKIIEQTLKKCKKHNGIGFGQYENVSKISKIVNQITGKSYVSYLSEAHQLYDTCLQDSDHPSLIPDKVIFCGSKILFCDELTKGIFEEFIKENGDIPKVVNYNYHTYFVAKTLNKCRDAEAIFLANYATDTGDRVNPLSKIQEKELVNMESEKYRSNL